MTKISASDSGGGDFIVGQKPVWFKKDMATATLEGRKTMTTRDHRLTLGLHTAVSGSRFKRRNFAIIKVLDSIETNWVRVVGLYYREEGFESPRKMMDWCKANGLNYANSDRQLYRHPYELVRKIAATPEPNAMEVGR